MKTNLTAFIILSVLIIGCSPAEFDDYPDTFDELYPTSTLVDYTLLQYDSATILCSFSTLSDNPIDLSEFVADGTVEEVDNNVSIVGNVNPALLLLVDQSGSYEELDPYNDRVKAIGMFFEQLSNAQSTFLLGLFANDELLSSALLEYSADDFNSEPIDQEFLYSMALKTGGKNFLYDAMDKGIDKLSGQQNTDRHLIVFLHSYDEGSDTDVNHLIDKAKTNNVKIDIIALDLYNNLDPFWELTRQTKGSFTICDNVFLLDSIFERLVGFISGSALVHEKIFLFKPYDKDVISGKEYEILFFDFNSLYLKIAIP